MIRTGNTGTLNKVKEKLSRKNRVSSASANVLGHHGFLIGASEKQVPNSESQNDGQENASVERHDSQHQEISDCRVDSEEHGRREFSGAAIFREERDDGGGGRRGWVGGNEGSETEASVFHVLVKGRE